MGKNHKAQAPTLPRIRYMSSFDLTHAPDATAARGATTGLVSMSTRPDPEGSGTVEIATRRCPRLSHLTSVRQQQQYLSYLEYSKIMVNGNNSETVGNYVCFSTVFFHRSARDTAYDTVRVKYINLYVAEIYPLVSVNIISIGRKLLVQAGFLTLFEMRSIL